MDLRHYSLAKPWTLPRPPLAFLSICFHRWKKIERDSKSSRASPNSHLLPLITLWYYCILSLKNLELLFFLQISATYRTHPNERWHHSLQWHHPNQEWNPVSMPSSSVINSSNILKYSVGLHCTTIIKFHIIMNNLHFAAISVLLLLFFWWNASENAADRLDISVTSVYLHYFSVIIAPGGQLDISAAASSLKQKRGTLTQAVVKMSLHHKEGSRSWIINQTQLRGTLSTAEGITHQDDVMLGDWLGWCHFRGGGDVISILNTCVISLSPFKMPINK